MAADCCYPGLPLLERMRNLAVTCLVLDSLFILIYTLTALSAMSISYKTACYEAHGYTWHNMIAFCYLVSAMASAVGAIVHGSLACNGPKVREEQLNNTSRYANILVCWIFTAAVVDAIAYRKEPVACANIYRTTDSPNEPEAYAADSTAHQDSSHIVWQLVYPLLWIAWVTGTVAAAVLSKRIMQEMDLSLQEQAPAASGAAMPEIVGTPLSSLPTGAAASMEPFGSTPGGHGVAAAGAPCGAVPAEATGAPSWQGGTAGGVAAGGLVAQGRPVGGSMPDPEKSGAGRSVPKTV